MREALGRYIAYQQQIDHLRKTLVNASIYPAVLIAAGMLVMVFLSATSCRASARSTRSSARELPLASRMLMQWGQLLQQHAVERRPRVRRGRIGGRRTPCHARRRGALRRRSASRAFRRSAAQLRIYQLARLYRTVGMLLRGGMPVVTACEMSAGLLERRRCARRWRAATQAVREGQSIANAFERCQLTTPVAARMLRVGERSGNMGEMMERIAAFYDDELSRAGGAAHAPDRAAADDVRSAS